MNIACNTTMYVLDPETWEALQERFDRPHSDGIEDI